MTINVTHITAIASMPSPEHVADEHAFMDVLLAETSAIEGDDAPLMWPSDADDAFVQGFLRFD